MMRLECFEFVFVYKSYGCGSTCDFELCPVNSLFLEAAICLELYLFLFELIIVLLLFLVSFRSVRSWLLVFALSFRLRSCASGLICSYTFD